MSLVWSLENKNIAVLLHTANLRNISNFVLFVAYCSVVLIKVSDHALVTFYLKFVIVYDILMISIEEKRRNIENR